LTVPILQAADASLVLLEPRPRPVTLVLRLVFGISHA
jgi:hypothetical protein